MMTEEIVGDRGFMADENCGFTFEVSSNPREFDTFRTKQEGVNFSDTYYHIGNWRILPYGHNDDLPRVIKNTVQENSSAPGMLDKKFMMIYGQGPYLFTEEIDEASNTIVKKLVKDDDIQAWLDSWDYKEYLIKVGTDYIYMQGGITKFFRNRASRIGGDDKIAKLDHILLDEGRLACPVASTELKPTHIVETDFSLNSLDSITNMKVYPIFDYRDPFKYPTSAYYSNQYSFGDKWYTTPPIFGSLEWLRRSTATPIIFKALSKNSINIKYHVESPQAFWDAEQERIEKNCKAKGITYDDQMLIDYRKGFLKDLLKVLAAEENTGKLWHTRKILEVQGNNVLEHGWTINVIDQKIKDFVSAQIQISQRADRAVSAGIGLHGSIGNIAETGKSDSGSEQVYAYQNFVNSGVEVPEFVICKPINFAIKVNFPKKKHIQIGFHQITTQKQQDINPKDRIVNQETK